MGSRTRRATPTTEGRRCGARARTLATVRRVRTPWWELRDPDAPPLHEMRAIRDEIAARVDGLLRSKLLA